MMQRNLEGKSLISELMHENIGYRVHLNYLLCAYVACIPFSVYSG